MTKEVNSKYRRLRIRSNINNRNQRTKTKLATHVWSLKDARPPIPYTIKWKIIDKGKPFNPVTGFCRLFLKEKYHILYNRQDCSQNSRDELRDHLLYKIKEGVTWTTGIFFKKISLPFNTSYNFNPIHVNFLPQIEKKSQYPMSPLGWNNIVILLILSWSLFIDLINTSYFFDDFGRLG